jgi:hypothetical protein
VDLAGEGGAVLNRGGTSGGWKWLPRAFQSFRRYLKPLAKIRLLDDKCAKLAPVQPGAT